MLDMLILYTYVHASFVVTGLQTIEDCVYCTIRP